MSEETRIYSLPAAQPFVDALAGHVLGTHGADPLALSAVWILLPSRRACLSLRSAFLRAAGGKPMLLPRMLPLGDMDEDAMALGALGGDASRSMAAIRPAISDTRRLLMLAQLIMELHRHENPHYASFDQATRLARELMRFQDEVERNRLSGDALADIVPQELAEHWQVTREFLKLLFTHWPAILEEENALNPVERRNRVLLAWADAWKTNPPGHPVIAAGSTGSIPATAALLKVVAALPQGEVILPGFDKELSEDVPIGPEHYQYGLRELLRYLECDPGKVRDIAIKHLPSAPQQRLHLLRAALLPPEETHQWPHLHFDRQQALTGWRCFSAPLAEEEAKYISLLLRETLETPGKTAALVTPDRQLARRVAAYMRRFGVAVDDSAGRPLMLTETGVYFRALAEVAVSPTAAALLALFKHPLARAGRKAVEIREAAREAEILLLRGVRLQEADLLAHVAANESLSDSARQVWHSLQAALEDFIHLCGEPEASFAALLRAHVQAAENLAALPGEAEEKTLWNTADGAAFYARIEEWLNEQDALDTISPRAYRELLDVLLEGQVHRFAYGTHPRLHILSPIEARLQHYDRIILGGLNEGSWPPEPAADPWMSRPMRARFGLPAPERAIGQSAHDFVMLCGAPEVILTRAEKREGKPTLPSRWLLRLESVLQAGGYSWAKWQQAEAQWRQWAENLDTPDTVQSMAPPAATPPVYSRPRKLSATQLDRLVNDPYRIYAEKVLRLKPLHPLDQEPDQKIYGTVLHKAMELFVQQCPAALPPDALEVLMECGRKAFAQYNDRPAVAAYWWPRFSSAAAWAIEQEKARRAAGIQVMAERTGSMTMRLLAGPFEITAKMDRLEQDAQGNITLIDYKTGTPPGPKKVSSGEKPQLPVEALIVQKGGVCGLRAPAQVQSLEYWRLSGNADKCGIVTVSGDKKITLQVMLENIESGLRELLSAFDEQAQPYVVKPAPQQEARYNDYEHLERIKEWA